MCFVVLCIKDTIVADDLLSVIGLSFVQNTGNI